MLQKIKEKIKKDDGNATIMLGIMLIICLIVVGGTMLDFSKAQMLKSSYIDAAKKATQAGAMEQNSRGSIKAEAIGKTLYSYENIMRPAMVNTDGYFSKCKDYNEDDVVLTVTLTDFDGESRAISIGRKEVSSYSSADAINNNLYSLNSTYRTMKEDVDAGRFRPNRVMLELTEGTENTVLPVAFKLTGNESHEGMKCQKINVAARASTFLGDEAGAFD